MEDYDVGKAFAEIENELLNSMMRNMKLHRAEEKKEGYEWTQWQVMQVQALEEYKKRNRKKFALRFQDINDKIRIAILKANAMGKMVQEIGILRAIKEGEGLFRRPYDKALGEFFKTNDRKLNALIDATIHDMEKAEQAILRMHDDKVRKAIFNAQVYANTGAGTYEKAVDMAVKDYISSGINCVKYKNGRQVNIKDYADMAIRTANKRAYLSGEGVKRREWGISTVIMNKRGNACPLCLPYVGKVLVDDVWSGGTEKEAEELGYPLMSHAISGGLYHPNCKDVHTTYFEGISTPPSEKWTQKELEDIKEQYARQQKVQYAKHQAEKYERLEKHALDAENKRQYGARKEEWRERSSNYGIDKVSNTAILNTENTTKEVVAVHSVGKINKDIYKCVMDDILTDEVIITDERIQHIKERHPNDYERFYSYIPEIVANPDYIIEANKPNTAVILKEIEDKGEKFKLVLRLKVKEDPVGYKNSVMTFWKIGDTTWKKSIKNKNILYKRE